MKKIAIFLVLVVIGIVPKAFAASWYVDNAASGRNDGTSWADAWESFADISWGSVSAGDTIYISGGATRKTYNETLTIGKSGTSGNQISMKTGALEASPDPSHDGLVIIEGGATRSNCINIGGYDYITINGEDGSGGRNIKCQNSTGSGITANAVIGLELFYIHVYRAGRSTSANGIYPTNGCYAEIAYCKIEDSYGDGLKLGGHTDPGQYGNYVVHHNIIQGQYDDAVSGNGSIDFYKNEVHLGGDPFGVGGNPHRDGMQLYAGYLRIYDNIFTMSFAGYVNSLSLFLDPSGMNHNPDHVRFYNNIVFTTGDAYAAEKSYAISLKMESSSVGNIDDVYVVNNTFVDVGYYMKINSELSSSKFTNFVIENNIFHNINTHAAGGSAIYVGRLDYNNSTITIDKNTLSAGVGGGSEITWNGTQYSVANFNSTFSKNNIEGNVTFQSYSAGNCTAGGLRLDPTDTDALNQGKALGISNMDSNWPDDFIDVSRPQDSKWDIGAYERSGSSSAPSPPEGLRIVQ